MGTEIQNDKIAGGDKFKQKNFEQCKYYDTVMIVHMWRANQTLSRSDVKIDQIPKSLN